jgi:hypothetical protein
MRETLVSSPSRAFFAMLAVGGLVAACVGVGPAITPTPSLSVPTLPPSFGPTLGPTPTVIATPQLTLPPTPTLLPTDAPTLPPTLPATPEPTGAPTPTQPPTQPPTDAPTEEPTPDSTVEPTDAPPGDGVLDYSKMPNYGSVELHAGFQPDPHAREVTSGGRIDASYLGGGCAGDVTSAPDYEVTYSAGSANLLRFYFVADDPTADTTLIVNDPTASWVCGDDSYDSSNPTVDFTAPEEGTYDVWIGSWTSGANWEGTLYVTELDSNHPQTGPG